MKRISIFIALLACALMNAQNINDVLRYSNDNLQGTARFQGMGGAFGAVGGDLSALNINPAGSAVFNHGLLTISGTAYNTDNSATYFNTSTGTIDTYLDINQLGASLVFNSKAESTGWDRIVLAFNYDMITNFDSQVLVDGTSDQSIENYFLSFAQGVPFGNILLQDGEFIEDAYLDIGAQGGFADQQAFLGYYGGIIDPETTDEENTVYNGIAEYNNVNQRFSRTTAGFNSKYTLNFAARYQERLHLGASLNFHGVDYDRVDLFREDGYATDSEVQFVNFDNFLRTEGAGFSFSTGAIYKINELVRLGASYQSPTWYRLEDSFAQRINSDLADEDIDFIDSNIITIFDTYSVKTPAKLTGSLALVFGKSGLLSVDYGYQDMSNARLGRENEGIFSDVNDEISNQLGATSTIRVGGEYRIARFSLRGGYRYEQSPYENSNLIGDLNGISAGLGYDFGGSRLDFAFMRSEQETALRLFDTGLVTPATIDRINTNVTLSYTYNF
ncbi:aromatic hydrocarbon degradation protein [Aggregatimonas sangjinii]|uniref:Aromatic hydrocarbon degradation protein n=1 Tax=Aggregatimonas sangjinii TaxID=2583587 RepID=A0A5B7SRQ0_9FLAO|nr:outer membrane protein transport protein [Aggregatimonas sangjinii]QCX00902.1 aromatic hydrocarbon degradation protein [Aggregatimonas sangjinii]